jgi:diguanylate cyclase (GGDEF)-like protein
MMTLLRKLRANWFYLLIFTPFVTDILENAKLPVHPREFVTEILMGVVVAIGLVVIRRQMRMLRTVAETDALTGLLNRRRFMADLEREVNLSRRLRAPLSLVYIDVNDFKQINDNHGHAVGDAVLRDIGELLHHTARRDIDFSYRIGGDEFALLLIGITEQQGEEMLHRLQTQQPHRYPQMKQHEVTLSFGIAHLQHGESAENFLHRADAMMYQRKTWRRHGTPESTSVIAVNENSKTLYPSDDAFSMLSHDCVAPHR